MLTVLFITGLFIIQLLCIIYMIKIIKEMKEEIIKQLQLKIVELHDLHGYRKSLEDDLIEYRKKHDIDLLAAELKDYRKGILDDLHAYQHRLKVDIDILAEELKMYREHVEKDLKEYRELEK